MHHDQPAPPLSPLALAAQPHLLPDGSLYLPKQAQHLLEIRTQAWSIAPKPRQVTLVGEVQAQPSAAVAFTAAEPGRLEAAGTAWILAGQSVQAGQLLAWLRPLQSQRDSARRRAQVADLDQKLIIANLNVGRLKLQGAVNANSGTATGNIYLEDATTERDSLQRQREVIAQSLEERMPLRAPVSGRVLAAPARAGDVVGAGQLLFQFDDPVRLRISVPAFDAALGSSLQAAHARVGAGDDEALLYRGQEPRTDAPGWRLLFDLAASATDLSPGQPIEVKLAISDSLTALPAGACTQSADGAAQVWVHRTAEQFAPLRLKSCGDTVALGQGDRLVVHGAELLSQYR